MINLRAKRILVTLILTLVFLFANAAGMNFTNMLRGEEKYKIAYAAPRSSSGGFKSGSFSSTPKSSSGGFKSGSFFNSGSKSSSSSYSFPRATYGRSYFPIPFPIPFFGGRTFLGSWLLGGVFDLVKLIIIFTIAYIIIKNLKRRR